MKLRAVELFVGAGGLAMGVSEAGFAPDAVVEWDRHACATLRRNKSLGVDPVATWPDVAEMDVRDFDYRPLNGKGGIDLVAGGPPCQPFSLGGKHRGNGDRRDMFPEAIRAVRELRPRAFIFENVKGLLRPSFKDYLDYVLLQLRFPNSTRDEGEEILEHMARLRRRKANGLTYEVRYRLLNAADYGVPQRRERTFIVGFRRDLGIDWDFPRPTHSLDALLWSQWVTGDYWERHRMAKKHRPEPPRPWLTRIEMLRSSLFPPPEKPWRTVRDAIADLPEPNPEASPPGILNHVVNLGARSYPGHTGSPLDEPAKTLKAGVHGVPGGENMLRQPDGSVRYFTVRESARIQGFPDEFGFDGTWSENMRQLGNAVPVKLAQVVAESVRDRLEG